MMFSLPGSGDSRRMLDRISDGLKSDATPPCRSRISFDSGDSANFCGTTTLSPLLDGSDLPFSCPSFPPRTSTTPEPVLHSQAIPSIGICCSSLTQTITPHYGFVYLSMEQEYN
ncbi:uncharacterized protein [Drosophila takahashii]|uniref:uncharacterized protein isoform X3 n=1 Tax=Drosophila takahashii TaxID=29030 RepID=UPI003898FF20